MTQVMCSVYPLLFAFSAFVLCECVSVYDFLHGLENGVVHVLLYVVPTVCWLDSKPNKCRSNANREHILYIIILTTSV